jgi:hypothetical protein
MKLPHASFRLRLQINPPAKLVKNQPTCKTSNSSISFLGAQDTVKQGKVKLPSNRGASFLRTRTLGKQLMGAFVILAVPFFFAGCGAGGSQANLASATGPGVTSGSTGTSGSSGGSGSTGSTGSSGSGSGSTGSTGSSGGSGSTGSGSSGGSGSGSTGSGGSGSGSGSGSAGSGGSGSGSGSTGSGGSGSGSGSTGSGGSGSGSGGSGATGTVISNVQTQDQTWQSWGQGAPSYTDCSPSPCHGYQWSMNFGVTLPSLSNNATQFNLGGPQGTAKYGDALFSSELIGSLSKHVRDSDHSLLPTLHEFTYDMDFYVTDPSITQVLEFDITMYMKGAKMIWGTQCNYLGDHDWDIYDNAGHKWVSAGVPCQLVQGWNHLTLHMHREDDNTLLYESITLDGTIYNLNKTSAPGTASSNWWAVTVNYQMDGNSEQTPNKTYVDNFTFTYS